MVLSNEYQGLSKIDLLSSLLTTHYSLPNTNKMVKDVQLLHLIILIGAAQGFLLALAILNKKGPNNSHLLLCIAFIILSLRLAIFPFVDLDIISPSWNFIKNSTLLLLLLVGPALFLFIRLQLNPRKLHANDLVHLVPFLLFYTHLVYPVFNLCSCYSYATLWSAIAYGAASIFFIINKFHEDLSLKIATNSTPARLLKIAFPLFFLPVFIMNLVAYSRPFLGFHPATLPYLMLTGIFYRMGYKAMTKPKSFLSSLVVYAIHPKKTGALPLKLKQLILQVEKKELYLDQQLNLQKLSIYTGLSRHEISELLNHHLGKSFNAFINHYRIEAAKSKLCDHQFDHLSIMGIAQESGFSSKSSFNLIFKRQTGLTPSEFKKSGENK